MICGLYLNMYLFEVNGATKANVTCTSYYVSINETMLRITCNGVGTTKDRQENTRRWRQPVAYRSMVTLKFPIMASNLILFIPK